MQNNNEDNQIQFKTKYLSNNFFQIGSFEQTTYSDSIQQEYDCQNLTENYTNKAEDNNNKQKNQLVKRCDVSTISWLTKIPSEQSTFLMYGDLLIETKKDFDVDIDYIQKICDMFLQKKRVAIINHDKVNHLIESCLVNQKSGLTNFQYVKQRLLNSQNQYNYLLAQHLDTYEQNIHEIYIQYMRLFAEKDQELILQSQQKFVYAMTKGIIGQMKQNDQDFFQYVFFSFIDEHDLGHPVQLKQGVSEASSALFGLEPAQLIELMSRFGFIENIIMKAFKSECNKNEILNQILLMTNVQFYTSIQDYYDRIVPIMTIDGIQFNVRMIVKQYSQKINEMTITTLYTSQFQIEADELQRIIQIRQSQSNLYSPFNFVDLILNQSAYNKSANSFAQFLNNPQQFRPLKEQDQFPFKTCKYRNIQTTNA